MLVVGCWLLVLLSHHPKPNNDIIKIRFKSIKLIAFVFIVCCFVVVCCSLFVVRRLLFVVCRLLSVVLFLFLISCLLFVVCCVLFVFCWWLVVGLWVVGSTFPSTTTFPLLVLHDMRK